jgi:hypothetical protein
MKSGGWLREWAVARMLMLLFASRVIDLPLLDLRRRFYHPPRWCASIRKWTGDTVAAGYRGCRPRPSSQHRSRMFDVFESLLASSQAMMVESQSNDALLTVMLHTLALFKERPSPAAALLRSSLRRACLADDGAVVLAEDQDREAIDEV